MLKLLLERQFKQLQNGDSDELSDEDDLMGFSRNIKKVVPRKSPNYQVRTELLPDIFSHKKGKSIGNFDSKRPSAYATMESYFKNESPLPSLR